MYPEYVEVEGKRYKINTDFRVAIECNRIAEDDTIGNFERALGVIYMLYGDEGLNHPEHQQKLLELAQKYLACNKEIENKKNENPDMDYIQDYDLIWTSMYSDYNGLDIDKEEIHWWKFTKLMNGLSNSELGNSCVLNRVRNIRTMNPNEIKDRKERQKLIDLQEQFALKKNKKKKKPLSEKEKESAKEFLKNFVNRKE